MFSDNWKLLCSFNMRRFYLLASLNNDEHYVNEAKNVNKDSPKQTTLPSSVF